MHTEIKEGVHGKKREGEDTVGRPPVYSELIDPRKRGEGAGKTMNKIVKKKKRWPIT